MSGSGGISKELRKIIAEEIHRLAEENRELILKRARARLKAQGK